MYRAAVIGDRDSIYGFAALGLEVFPVTDSEMGSKTLRRLAEGEYAVIYITEALAAELEERRGAIQEASRCPPSSRFPALRATRAWALKWLKNPWSRQSAPILSLTTTINETGD